MVVLDTHVALWWIGDPGRLGTRAGARIRDADRLGIPTIVFWEIAMLVRRRRVELDVPVGVWVQSVCAIPRVHPLPLVAEIAVHADALDMHADPADRFIVATALHHEAPLVSKDRLMRALRFVETIW